MLSPNFVSRSRVTWFRCGFLPSIASASVLVEAVVERGVDDVVGGREAEARVGLHQREVLQMRIAVADEHKDDEAAEEARHVNLGAGGMLPDDTRYVLIGARPISRPNPVRSAC